MSESERKQEYVSIFRKKTNFEGIVVNMRYENLMKDEFIFGAKCYGDKICIIKPTIVEKSNSPKSGGCQVRFITNSRKIIIRYNISEEISGNFPHVGITARKGLSILYRKTDENLWRTVDCIYSRGSGEFQFDMQRFAHIDQNQEIMLCLPMLSYVTILEVGIEDSSVFHSISKNNMENILVLGGLNSYGIGCTSTAMMFSNILARKLNAIVYNFSFNNVNYLYDINNYLNEIISELSKLDYVIFEGDYIRQDKQVFTEYFERIMVLLDQLDIPIVLWGVSDKSLASLNKGKFSIGSNVWRFPISEKFDKDRDMYSTNFINDTANIYFYKMFLNIRNQFKERI